MAIVSSQGKDDLPPFITDLPATPSTGHIFTGPKRSVTPRGPLFPNLDEAHRKITSRLAPNNPFSKPAVESQSNPDIHLQELCNPTSAYGLPNDDTADLPGSLHRHASNFVSPRPSHSMAGRSLTDRESMAKLTKKCIVKNFGVIAATDKHEHTYKETSHPDTTGSTVSRIVDQYVTNPGEQLSASFGDSESAYTFKPLNRVHGAATRLGFRGEEDRVGRRFSTNLCREASSPPQFRISETPADAAKELEIVESQTGILFEDDWFGQFDPQRCVSLLVHQTTSPRASDFGILDGFDSDYASDAENDDAIRAVANRREIAQSLVPSPLRIPSNTNQGTVAHSSSDLFRSHVDSSLTFGAWDGSTESNEDPFQYDNEQHKRMRQIGKEREVSCALRRTSPSGTLSGVSENSVVYPTKNFPDNSPPQETFKGHVHRRIGDIRQEGSFLDPVAFRALHGDAPYNEKTDIRVVINRSSKSVASHEVDASTRSNFGLSFEGGHRPLGRSPYDQPVDGDWVTEATSGADFDMGAGDGTLGHGIKATGSSIADYSDDAYTDHFSRFSSRERILAHPHKTGESYELQDLKNMKRLDLPRPGASRFINFGQKTSRSDLEVAGSMDTQSLLLNPFRRDYKRAEPSSYFSYKPDNMARSKYEFRDSTSTYAPPVDGNRVAQDIQGSLPPSSMASTNHTELLDKCVDPYVMLRDANAEARNHRRGHSRQPAMISIPKNVYRVEPSSDTNTIFQATPLTATSFSEGPASTSSKFSFKLLDLSEAQEMQRIWRESEDTNKTSSTAKGKRSVSESLSVKRSLTALPIPSAAYVRKGSHVRRGSRLSSTFILPPWEVIYAEDTSRLGEYAPLDASAPRSPTLLHGTAADTPTDPKRVPSQQTQSGPQSDDLNFYIPNSQRIRPRPSDRTLRSIVHHDIEAVRAASDHYVSYKAKSRRRLFFYSVLCLSILPFFAILVLNGTFDSSLSWFTHGEVCRLTKKQRRVIKIFFVAEVIVYATLVASIIAYYVLATGAHQG